MQLQNLKIGQRVPDAKIIRHFKNELAQAGMIETLFNKVHTQLVADGIIVNNGIMVDASFVCEPKQRNSRSENEQNKGWRITRRVE